MNNKMDKEITEILLKNAFEEYENERFDEIIEKYKDTEPEYSEEHKRRMEKLFKKEKKSFCWCKFVKRAAMIILAVFISGALALQVEAVRIRIENWYYEVTNKAIHIGDSIEDLPGYSEADMPIYVLSDEFVEKYGYSMTQEIENRRIKSIYESVNEKHINIFQLIDDSNVQIDNNEGEIIKKKVNEKEIMVVKREEDMSLYLKIDDNPICIHTNEKEEKIEEIVSNLVIKS